MQRATLLFAGLMVLWLTGCSSGSGSGGNPDPNPDPPVGLLSKVSDTAAFESSIKAGLTAMTNPEVLAAAGEAQSTDFTGTYTQEVNVDELDGVRYDGSYLYVAPRRYFQCCFILEDAQFAPDQPPPSGAIRILQTDPATGSADAVGQIALDAGTSVQGMYVEGNRMFALTAQMIYGSYGQLWADVAVWAPEELGFSIYDVSDPADPIPEIEATLDGVFVQSRRIGNTVYVVSRYAPWVEGLHYYVSTPEQQAENDALLASATLDDLLPKITIGGETSALVQPENCYVTTDGSNGNPVLTSVTAIPLDDPANFTTACYSESAYGVYVSDQALYFAELRPNTAAQKDVTRIHKFALTGTAIAYRGSADIDGTVWQGNQPDFRLSERDGMLRVLASQFDWGSPDFVDHQLYVLAESAARPDLEIVSTLPNAARPNEIGKPNEALFGVRFTDDRAYAVTFEQIDPLYVIDLADPSDPYIAGELEVSGFSDLLHPVNDDLLLGIGRDVQGGVKVELFDVSNIAQPLSRGSAALGGPGSYSEAVYDRHAFTYQADVGGIDRFIVPANLFATDGSYQFLGSALHLFEILDKDMPALSALNSLGAIEPPSSGQEPDWVERSRAFIHDDTVYYVRDEAVWAAMWQTPTVVNGPF